jgi:hypothetical protein
MSIVIRNAGTKKMSTIIGEMLNFEVGRRMFVDGVYQPLPVDKKDKVNNGGKEKDTLDHAPFRVLTFDGVTVRLKPTFGFLYVDESILKTQETQGADGGLDKWIKILSKRITEVEREVPPALLEKYGRRNTYFPIETGEDGFTSTKLRTKTFDTEYVKQGKHVERGNIDRAIIDGGTTPLTTIKEEFGRARFTWVIYPIERLLHGIGAGAINPAVDKAIQLTLTMVYDPKSMLKPKNTTLVEFPNSSLEFCHTEFSLCDMVAFNQILPVYSGGVLSIENLVKKLKAKKSTVESDTSVTESVVEEESIDSSSTTEPQSIVSLIEKKHKENLSLDKMLASRSLKSLPIHKIRYPGFVPGWNLNNFRILYCPTRLGALELIRQMGVPYTLYANEDSLAHVPIRNLEVPVFDTKQAIIDNSPDANDVCKKCKTPLYDVIYVTYATQSDKTCKAYCHICMHSVFSSDGSLWTYPDAVASVTTLYQGCAVLAKYRFPRSVDKVIDMIESEEVKTIVRGFYSKHNTNIGNDFLFINCTITSNTSKVLLDSKVYIGITDLDRYIEWCYKEDYYVQPKINEFMGSFKETVFQNSIIFPITIAQS